MNAPISADERLSAGALFASYVERLRSQSIEGLDDVAIAVLGHLRADVARRLQEEFVAVLDAAGDPLALPSYVTSTSKPLSFVSASVIPPVLNAYGDAIASNVRDLLREHGFTHAYVSFHAGRGGSRSYPAPTTTAGVSASYNFGELYIEITFPRPERLADTAGPGAAFLKRAALLEDVRPVSTGVAKRGHVQLQAIEAAPVTQAPVEVRNAGRSAASRATFADSQGRRASRRSDDRVGGDCSRNAGPGGQRGITGSLFGTVHPHPGSHFRTVHPHTHTHTRLHISNRNSRRESSRADAKSGSSVTSFRYRNVDRTARPIGPPWPNPGSASSSADSRRASTSRRRAGGRTR
jgi:hypothetical protein